MNRKEHEAVRIELLQMRAGAIPADIAATAVRIEAAIDNLRHRLFLVREATRMEESVSIRAYISDDEPK